MAYRSSRQILDAGLRIGTHNESTEYPAEARTVKTSETGSINH